MGVEAATLPRPWNHETAGDSAPQHRAV